MGMSLTAWWCFPPHDPESLSELMAMSEFHKDNEVTNITTSATALPPYIQKNCDLTNVEEWMISPRRNTTDWRRRAPAFLVLGAKKCGTTALFDMLTSSSTKNNTTTRLGEATTKLASTRPQTIIRGRVKELQFFIPHKPPFRKFWKNGPGSPVLVASARAALWHHPKNNHYDDPATTKTTTRHGRQQQSYYYDIPTLMQDSSILTGEATPDYLMFPDDAAQAIFCTIPWVKLIVVLRNPLERLYSHYNYLRGGGSHDGDAAGAGGHRHSLRPFEDWVRGDIDVLQQVGVLPHDLTQVPVHAGTPQERAGWRAYQRLRKPGRHNPGSDRHFCRSLYAPQLEQWIEAIRSVHPNQNKKSHDVVVQDHLRIVLSQDLKRDGNVARDLVNWLVSDSKKKNARTTTTDVANHMSTRGMGQEHDGTSKPNHYNNNNNNNAQGVQFSMVTQYSAPPIRNEFRQFLRLTIFDHYNRRLANLLEQNGFDQDLVKKIRQW